MSVAGKLTGARIMSEAKLALGERKNPTSKSCMTFSTHTLNERDRLGFWADIVCSQLIRAEIRTSRAGRRGFYGSLDLVRAGGMDVCHISAAAQQVVRTPALLQRVEDPMCVIALQVTGEARISQNGRCAVLQPGDMTLFSNFRRYELCFDQEFEQRVFIIPQSLCQGVVRDMNALAAVTLHRTHPGNRILGAYAEALVEKPGVPESQASQLREGMLQTLSAVLDGAVGLEKSRYRPMRRYHLARIQAFIRDNLADPRLGVEWMSAALQLSPSHIHRIFEGQAQTLSATIWQQRLEACRLDLARPELLYMDVGEIGYRWGFSDLAHFSRRFRQTFGVGPRAWRHAQLGSRSGSCIRSEDENS